MLSTAWGSIFAAVPLADHSSTASDPSEVLVMSSFDVAVVIDQYQ